MSEVERQSFAKDAKIVWIVVNEDTGTAWSGDKNLLFGHVNKHDLFDPRHVFIFEKGSRRCTRRPEESRY